MAQVKQDNVAGNVASHDICQGGFVSILYRVPFPGVLLDRLLWFGIIANAVCPVQWSTCCNNRFNVCLSHALRCSAAAVIVCVQEQCAPAGTQQDNGMTGTQHPPQLNFGPGALNNNSKQHAEHAVPPPLPAHSNAHHGATQQSSLAEVQRLTHAVVESEQRAAAAELAVAAVQKACNEAVERSARLQVGRCTFPSVTPAIAYSKERRGNPQSGGGEREGGGLHFGN